MKKFFLKNLNYLLSQYRKSLIILIYGTIYMIDKKKRFFHFTIFKNKSLAIIVSSFFSFTLFRILNFIIISLIMFLFFNNFLFSLFLKKKKLLGIYLNIFVPLVIISLIFSFFLKKFTILYFIFEYLNNLPRGFYFLLYYLSPVIPARIQYLELKIPSNEKSEVKMLLFINKLIKQNYNIYQASSRRLGLHLKIFIKKLKI